MPAPADGKPYTVRDSEQTGLICRVFQPSGRHPAGKRMLSVYRKPKGGTAPVRVNICEVGELPMTALKGSPSVRSSADAILAKLREGTNPNIERRQQQAEAKRQQAADNLAGLTLGQAFEKYVEVKELRKQTLDGYRRAIERDLKPWKDKPLKDITGAMAVARHAELRKDSAHVAMRAMQVLRAVHIFATDFYGDDDEEQPARPFGRCPVDKLNKIVEKWSRTKARTRKLRTEDLGQWLAAVRSLPEQQKRADGDWARVAVYLELLLLTGLRRREAAYMLWADVDLRGDTMTVRATKNGDDHTLPITARVRELLAIRKRAADAARDLAQRDPTDANKAAAEHAATYVIGTAQVQRQLDAIEATTGITATPHLISKDLPLGLTG